MKLDILPSKAKQQQKSNSSLFKRRNALFFGLLMEKEPQTTPTALFNLLCIINRFIKYKFAKYRDSWQAST